MYHLVLRQRQQKRLTSKTYETYEWLPKLSNKQSHFFFPLYISYIAKAIDLGFSSICTISCLVIYMISFSSIDQTVHFFIKEKNNFHLPKLSNKSLFGTENDELLITDFFLLVLNRSIASFIRAKYVSLHFKVLMSVA